MTFSDFQRQYDAVAQEKGEGYFPFHFAGMSGDELAHARSMLLERALAGDTVDLDGLRLVGDATTVTGLRAAANRVASLGARWDIVRRETLFQLTSEPAELEPLLAMTDGGSDDEAKMAAEALARHSLPGDFGERIAERLTDGRHECIVGPLVDAWLASRGVRIWEMSVFQKHLTFIKAACAAGPARRKKILADVQL
ncbi:hypothetical protein KZX46_16745 [Polymorphobacter sp. PAMC 29334]|uniref:hypothetical protein n=1 Tax=Polymorphobacter sp. PAMC 29334 TaxID=2862331 RepID=UPI001C775D0A|nr:hypothetical protein [Polymorphobacter sp. PAMC 29334]QYE34408.1 hypothetical protein KZX46_16745 [Polymorphobacter sp. PAMC 29334]